MKKEWVILFISLGISNVTNAMSELETGLEAYQQKNYKLASKQFEKLSKNGNAEATYYLASLYFQGYGVPKDLNQAFNLFQQSAEHGYAPSLANLAIMYNNGLGIQKNIQKAFEYRLKAANAGDLQSQYNLAQGYRKR